MSFDGAPEVLPPDLSQSPTVFGPRLQIVVFGDSLTQRGSQPDGWVTLLSHYYSRKSDTLNRGYSGYNSNHAVALLKQHLAAGVWPTSTAESGKGTDRPTLMTLCLGANDSCLPDAASAQQSVPLEQYRDNLAHMLRTLKGDDGKANPQLHLVLIGPPQVDDKHWGLVSQQRHNLPSPIHTRDNSHTRLYSDAASSVAQQFGVPFLDMYSQTGDRAAMLCDGLHYTPRGNHLLFTRLVELVRDRWPHLAPERLPVDSFPFMQIESRTLDDTMQFFQQHADKTNGGDAESNA